MREHGGEIIVHAGLDLLILLSLSNYALSVSEAHTLSSAVTGKILCCVKVSAAIAFA